MRKKSIKRIVVSLFIVITIGGIYYLWNALPIITGYTAKNLCSCYFLSHRSIESVKKQELGFFPVSFATLRINNKDSSVTSSVVGFAKKKAIFRSGAGCTLINGIDEATLRKQVFSFNNHHFSDSMSLQKDFVLDSSFPVSLSKKLSEAIQNSFTETNPEKPIRTRAVIILYDGKLVGEQYAPGFNQHTKLMGWSMTKSITGALIGLLVDAGKLNVDEPAPVPEWKDSNDKRRLIKLRHLLQQTSGLQFNEDYGSSSEATNMLFNQNDMAHYAASMPLKDKPGEIFYYSSGNTNLLSRIIRQSLTEEQYHAFPYTHLFNRIGMHSVVMEPDASGNFVGSSYMYATARDWAKFGLLYYNKGLWNNERILSEKWVEESVASGPSQTKFQYGYQFWLNSGMPADPAQRRYADAPSDMFYATGVEGQKIFIIPSKKLVVVRLALTQGNHFDENNFLKDVIDAFKSE